MTIRLVVAAGGGGDAVAAAMLRAAWWPDDDVRVITYAWDRLSVDPVPGPRDPSSFDGLDPEGEWNWRVQPTTRPRPPAGSLLPRLAQELDTPVYLLDPRTAAAGMHRQIRDLADRLGADDLAVLDVGGDILAHPADPAVRSPLADGLVLAATTEIPATRLMVAGPGLDGEVEPDQVRRRFLGHSVRAVDGDRLQEFEQIFAWHPSESAGLLWATTQGARGTAEIRDEGSRVSLADSSADVLVGSSNQAISGSIAELLVGTKSLDEAEKRLDQAGVTCELAIERNKAARTPMPRACSPAPAIDDVSRAARERGVDFLSLRRIGELAGVTRAQLAAEASRAPAPSYRPPLWVLRPAAWPSSRT